MWTVISFKYRTGRLRQPSLTLHFLDTLIYGMGGLSGKTCLGTALFADGIFHSASFSWCSL